MAARPDHVASASAAAPEAGRQRLFEDVTARCTGLITRIALSYEADEALRRELVQDIMLAVWIALPAFRGDSSLKTFVASIAQKRAITHVTRRAREPRKVELPEDLRASEMLPDEVAVRNDLKRKLTESIQLLPVPQREAIVLCFEGFSYTEMGQVLGISTNAAMLRCQRAKTTLKSIMEKRS